jgi:hypothetical protein
MKYGILSPSLGIKEDFPKVFIPDAFSPESEWILTLYGECRRMKGKMPEFFDAAGDPIQTPALIYAVYAVSQGNKTFTINSDVATAISAAVVGSKIRINGSTGNDGLYTVVTCVDGGTTAVITVSEAIPSATADGNVFVGYNPIIKYHTYKAQATATDYLLIGTKKHIFLWNATAKTLTVKWTCTGDCTSWSFANYYDNVYATNNVDYVLWWNSSGSTSNSFATLDSASGILVATGTYLTKAKYIVAYENYLILGYVTIGGTVYPTKIVYNRQGLDTNWNIDDVADIGCGSGTLEGKDFITGFGRQDAYLVIGRTDSIKYLYYTPEADVPFAILDYQVKVGVLAGDTMVNDKQGSLYWLASDFTIRKWNKPEAVSKPIDKTVRNVNITYIELAQAMFIAEYNQIWFSIPSGVDATANNKTLVYMPEDDKWEILPFGVRAFGSWKRTEEWSWSTLPFDAWDEWGWDDWFSPENNVGWPHDICSDYYGYTFQLHAAEKESTGSSTEYGSCSATAHTAKLVLCVDPEKKQMLDLYRRFWQLRFMFNKAADGVVTVSIKEDDAAAYTTLGTIYLTGNGEFARPYLPVDWRSKFADLKLEWSVPGEFLGVIFDYADDGEW